MRYLLLAILISIAGLGSCNRAQAAIGVVADHKGTACSIERNKQKLDGVKGAGVESMDIYTTGACVSNITFKDDTKVRVNENSRLLIDDFVFDPRASDAGKLALKVGAGTVRYASGQIAKNNPQQVNIKTPTAAIAVRGTDFTMTVDESGGSLVILLPSCRDGEEVKKYELDENRCKVGKIEVSTLSGMVTLDKAFEATFVLSAVMLPTAPQVLNITEGRISNSLILARPPAIQKAIASQLKTDADRDRDAVNDEAMARSTSSTSTNTNDTTTRVVSMTRAAAASGCNASTSVCVIWDNPDNANIQSRGKGIAFRSNTDNYAEVKTTGADSNTFVSITHNDSLASLMIGDSGSISNSVIIKQNTGVVKTK
jgi:hypothetical protein